MLENQIYSRPTTRSQKLFSQLDDIAKKTKLIVRKSQRFSALHTLRMTAASSFAILVTRITPEVLMITGLIDY